MNNALIYALACPETGQIKYVGKTNHSLKRRLQNHINNKRSKSRCSFWIRELKSKNIYPEIILLETVIDGLWRFRESEWIKNFGRDNLLNENAGGGGMGTSKINYVFSFSESLSQYSENTKRNYLSIVKIFLHEHGCVSTSAVIINKKMIENYMMRFKNRHSYNQTLSALKKFFLFLGQPRKLNAIKYWY